MATDPPSPSRAAGFFNPFGLGARALVLYHVLGVCLAVFTVDRIAAYQFRPSADSREIVLVGSETCSHSRAARERLLASGVPFREVSAEEDPFSRALASWALQSLSVPIVVVGPEIIYGNRSERIDAALAALGDDEPDASPPTTL